MSMAVAPAHSLPHSIARRCHAVRRAWERYRVRLHTGDVQVMERQIEERRALFICRASSASLVYLVTWRQYRFFVAYRPSERAISTFLTAKQVRSYL